MARKLRLEYGGAIQHVINRGNYRRNMFADDKTKAAFEACLFEACEKSNWILHAFIVMRNHYHLELETPEANLIAGMQWLQSTFACRFNRFRKENGHLFQGRYKSILTEEGKPIGEVCDYIHLNPVKAQISTVDQLLDYRYSSYWYLHHPERRPRFCRPQTALACAGGIPDTPEGWAQYRSRLELQAGELGTADRWRKLERKVCQGWAIGSEEFKASVAAEFKLAGLLRFSDSSGVKELRESRWETALDLGLKTLNRTPEEAIGQPKSAPWKMAVTAWMKARTQASNRWLSSKLHLGATTAVSHNLTVFRRRLQASDPAWQRLTSLYLA
jgi:REP element-mobilizing transposase RayT